VVNIIACMLPKLLKSRDGSSFRLARDFSIFTGQDSGKEREHKAKQLNDPKSPMRLLLISVKVRRDYFFGCWKLSAITFRSFFCRDDLRLLCLGPSRNSHAL